MALGAEEGEEEEVPDVDRWEHAIETLPVAAATPYDDGWAACRAVVYDVWMGGVRTRSMG